MLLHKLFAATLPLLAAAAKLPSRKLVQLPLGSFLENIRIRPNGDLLVTNLGEQPGIYIVKHPESDHATIDLLVPADSVEGVDCFWGITEIDTHNGTETYAVIGATVSALADPIPGGFSSWLVNFPAEESDDFHLKRVGSLPKSLFLNGMGTIPGIPNAALVADSHAGLVGRINLDTGEYDDTAFVYPEMQLVSSNELPTGVNGVHIHGSYLYFTNTNLVSIYRLPVTPAGFPTAGAKPELVANLTSLTPQLDDFTFDADGNIYTATFGGNVVIYVDVASGVGEVVVGGAMELTVAGVTSGAFGRGLLDAKTLYVTTSGALAQPVGNKTEGSKVMVIDTAVVR